MKRMTCKQLGGSCELAFEASSFDEIANLSKQHGMEMYQKKDADHLTAMGAMQQLMQDPEQMKKWFEARRQEFEDLPEGNG